MTLFFFFAFTTAGILITRMFLQAPIYVAIFNRIREASA